MTKRGRSISGRSGGASCGLHARGFAGELCASASASPSPADEDEEKDGERKKTQMAAKQKRRSLAASGRPRRAREDEDQAQDGAGDAKRAGRGAFMMRLERGDERKPMEIVES